MGTGRARAKAKPEPKPELKQQPELKLEPEVKLEPELKLEPEPERTDFVRPIEAFNWPPTEEDLAHIQAFEVEADTALVSYGDVVFPSPVTAGGMPFPQVAEEVAALLPSPPSPRLSRPAQALGLAILLGLGTAVGVGTALLLSPRTAAPGSAGALDAGWLSSAGPAHESGRAGGRPPDLTVIAEYPSVDVRAPRGMLPGGLRLQPLNEPSPPPDVVAMTPTPSSVGVPQNLPTPSLPSPPPVALAPVVTASPPPSALASTPTPVVVAPAVPTATAERSNIERLLGRYRTAYEALDTRAAAVVWPTVDTQELARAFNTLSRQELTFDRCDITIVDRRATAACAGELRYVRRVGGSAWQRRAAAWKFDLSREGESWTIQGVHAR